MAEATITVLNRSGLHARPAATFVRTAAGFGADVRLCNLSRDPGRMASAKSMLAVLGLGVGHGDEIRLEATGADADAAIDTLLALIAGGLGEGMAAAPPALLEPASGTGAPLIGLDAAVAESCRQLDLLAARLRDRGLPDES